MADENYEKPTRQQLRIRLQQGQALLGVITNVPSPAVSEMLALAGFDLVLMDMEHGPMSYESLENCARAALLAGSVPYARVYDNHPKLILRALDAGAMGVMVPAVNTAQELEQCVRAVRYAPRGTRGLAMSTFAGRYGTRDTAEHLRESDDSVVVLPQIETAEAYDNLDELLEVPGVDAFIVGPSDLSQSMGYPGEPGHPMVEKALADIIQRGKEAGRPVGTVAATPGRVRELRDLGAQVILTVVSGLLINAGRSFVQRSREALLTE